MAETISELKVAIGADLAKLQGQLNRMEGMMGKAGQKSANSFNSAMGSIQSTLAGVFSIGLLEQFISKSIQVTAEFEKMGAVLTTAFGSSAEAQLAMMDIVDFASKTPFQVSELTEAFVRFSGRGIKPSMQSMKSMGDLAAALGTDFQQLTEAILDVTSSERWTNVGLDVSVSGDKIIGTYRGVTYEFEKSEEGAMAMAEAFGNLEGVSGGMARISETLAGKLSNASDNFDTLLRNIGNSGAYSVAVDGLNDILNSLIGITELSIDNDFGIFEDLFVRFGAFSGNAQLAAISTAGMTAALTAQKAETRKLLEEQMALDNQEKKSQETKKVNAELVLKQADAFAKWTEKVNAASEAARAMEATIMGEMFNMDFQELSFGGQVGDMQFDLSMMDDVSMEVEEAFENMDLSSQRFFDNLQAQSEAFEFLQANAGMIGGAFQSAFDAALFSGENFMEVLGKSLEQLIQRLVSAAITATLLSLVFSSFTGGGGATFQSLFSQFGGFEFGLDGNNLLASGKRTQGQNNRIL